MQLIFKINNTKPTIIFFHGILFIISQITFKGSFENNSRKKHLSSLISVSIKNYEILKFDMKDSKNRSFAHFKKNNKNQYHTSRGLN